jgi:hypothetical protein
MYQSDRRSLQRTCVINDVSWDSLRRILPDLKAGRLQLLENGSAYFTLNRVISCHVRGQCNESRGFDDLEPRSEVFCISQEMSGLNDFPGYCYLDDPCQNICCRAPPYWDGLGQKFIRQSGHGFSLGNEHQVSNPLLKPESFNARIGKVCFIRSLSQ